MTLQLHPQLREIAVARRLGEGGEPGGFLGLGGGLAGAEQLGFVARARLGADELASRVAGLRSYSLVRVDRRRIANVGLERAKWRT